MTIKVVTMMGENYGSALQAYALQEAIKESGGGDKYCKFTSEKLHFMFFEELSNSNKI